MRAYIDTSVLAAYYAPEAGSAIVQRALADIDEPCISWLTQSELASAITRKCRVGELAEPLGNKIIDLFESHLEQRYFTLLPLDAGSYGEALQWVRRGSFALRSLDALHLAVAIVHELVIVTADNRLAEAAKESPVEVRYLDYST